MLALAELASLPLAAATLDDTGRLLARTPEWRGPGVAGVTFRHDGLILVVRPLEPFQDPAEAAGPAVVDRILAAIEVARAHLDSVRARRLAVLAEALQVVTGRPITARGTTDDVIDHLEACLPARSDVVLVVRRSGCHPVPAPAALSNALLQVVVNAAVHGGAQVVELDVGGAHGSVSFRLQWDGAPPAGVVLRTSRVQRQSDRTGLAAARVFADAVGATMTGLLTGIDPRTGRDQPGRTRMQLDLGDGALTLPLARALTADRRIRWCTPAWTEETGLRVGQVVRGEASEAVDRAAAAPGRIATAGALSARVCGETVWLAQPPDGARERARFAVRLLEHERALSAAPERDARCVRALCLALSLVLGDTGIFVTADRWNATIRHELAAHGLRDADIPAVDGERLLSPVLSAYLIATFGGAVEQHGDEVTITVGRDHEGDPLVRALSGARGVLLTPRAAATPA